MLLFALRKTSEPALNKTYNKTCATSENSDQPAHPRSLISVFADRICLLPSPGYPKRNKWDYFIVSGEISVYLVKIKGVSITSELISYHFTSDWYDLASDHNYFSITFRTKTSWEKNADNFAIDAYFLLLMSSFLTFKCIHFTHDHDQLLFLLSSVKVNTCQFIPVTAHVGSLLRGVLRFTCFPEIKRQQNKLLIFKTPTCWSIKRITVK